MDSPVSKNYWMNSKEILSAQKRYYRSGINYTGYQLHNCIVLLKDNKARQQEIKIIEATGRKRRITTENAG